MYFIALNAYSLSVSPSLSALLFLIKSVISADLQYFNIGSPMKMYQYIIPTILLSAFSLPTWADTLSNDSVLNDDYVTVTGYLGARLNQDIKNDYSGQDVDISSELTQAISLGWYYAKNAEGELIFSNSKQNFSSANDFDIDVYVQYLHVGGRILFRTNSPFSSSIGLGMGATHFNPSGSRYDAKFAFSASASAGIRYQLTEQFALRSDLRVYGTLLENSDEMFCDNGSCLLDTSDHIYVDAELLAGIEYKF